MFLCGMDEFKNIKRRPNADIIMALGKRFKEYRISSTVCRLPASISDSFPGRWGNAIFCVSTNQSHQ